ncbi:hypothetical protein R1flu_016349 [Riccia fluitans]|uniref:WLM domain-containing protein n=1 Tax=Riccia fluitans TaxID=41844 RepID=A0ABD1YLT2_9MARC
MEDNDLHFTVSYRGKNLQLTFPAGCTLGELGEKLVELTGVAPHTIKLMLPKRPPLQPMSASQSSTLLRHSGITEGVMVRLMGSSAAEVATVSQGSSRDTRVRGFAEEEELARRRAYSASSSSSLPKGDYIFCDFRTLSLPGVELTPPATIALSIMHKLASDRGIVAIMNKYRWRVDVMTEMAPVGYVGVSPKCILGFNKNRGQEISLRLRTDDLKGFRKYESIKKTLLHELAHMVHDEHDEKFHALDKKLNEEAIALDWTKSAGHTLSSEKHSFSFQRELAEEMDTGGVHRSQGYRLGGGSTEQARYTDPRAAAAAAALRRFSATSSNTLSGVRQTSHLRSISELRPPQVEPARHAEPDPDDMDSESMVVIAEGSMLKREPGRDEAMEVVTKHPGNIEPQRAEPEPDDKVETQPRSDEPDPDGDDEVMVKADEPDPDDCLERKVRVEPDPDDDDEVSAKGAEPDPDDHSEKLNGVAEPDPDDHEEAFKGADEPDPDDHREKSAVPYEAKNGGEMLSRGAEPDPDDREETSPVSYEPDPDDSVRNCKREAGETCSTGVREYKHQCSF